jgi:metal-responsive CopG/Arc/MetJ family transcriptional regulator
MYRKLMNENDKKSKINLTINENLLNEFDRLLENNDLKRSRIIEELLNKYISENKDKL